MTVRHVEELAFANRVLDFEGVLDAYGHVSVRDPRDPERFLLACSKSPALVEPGDIIAFGLDGEPARPDPRPLYSERFIHAGIYAARPDVMAVVHSHAEDVLPFAVSAVPLRPAIHSASNMGGPVPVWDIADRFGDTNLLVSDIAQANDLAAALGGGGAALMRGHGFVACAPTLIEVVRLSVYLPKNARVQSAAMTMGGPIRFLSEGEIDARRYEASNPAKAADYDPDGPGLRRAWDYWRHKIEHPNKCTCSAAVAHGAVER